MSETAKPAHRLFLASSVQAASVFGALGVANAAEEDSLGALYADLCCVHAERNVAEVTNDDDAFEELHARHWELREAINGIASTTLAGFRIKAITAELALDSDKEIECRGAGSFVDLCQSLHRDLLAVDGGGRTAQ
jgi:hypothetical protein